MVFLLALGELGTRIYYFYRSNYNPFYLTTPFGNGSMLRSEGTTKGKCYRGVDACSGRSLVLTTNSEGGRGPEWPVVKPKGTFRIIAMGASSTFGVDNPDWATWPVFLEKSLRRVHSGKIEVLNASLPGKRLADIAYLFRTRIYQYQPDMVLYYESWNDTPLAALSSEVHSNIQHIHRDTQIGRLAFPLHYRSMLYTYFLEKTHFYLAARARDGVVPRIGYFQAQLKRFIEMIQESRAIPILILQMNGSPPEPSARDLHLDDHEQVRTFILKAANANQTAYDHPTKIRIYQAQVLVEVVRRMGETMGVRVIDPRPALTHYQGTVPLFCGPIHLTDLGNQLLAHSIAEQLRLTISQ